MEDGRKGTQSDLKSKKMQEELRNGRDNVN